MDHRSIARPLSTVLAILGDVERWEIEPAAWFGYF
jgi:hypothetical protein